jgi:hypothetical protein
MMAVFWNTLAGLVIFPFAAVVCVAVVLTAIFISVGWTTVTVGSEVLLKDDAEFQKWKASGGRPYWDSLPTLINPATPLERMTGLAEPEYTDFIPPSHWTFQCPKCGARVQKQIDTCWRCFYGVDGDSTAYYERFGGEPDGK